MIKFPYSRPDVVDADVVAVRKALKGQYLTGGNIIDNFEKSISNRFNVQNSIVCNSGTTNIAFDIYGFRSSKR